MQKIKKTGEKTRNLLNSALTEIEVGAITPYESNSVIYTQRVSRIYNVVKFTLVCDTSSETGQGTWIASITSIE